MIQHFFLRNIAAENHFALVCLRWFCTAKEKDVAWGVIYDSFMFALSSGNTTKQSRNAFLVFCWWKGQWRRFATCKHAAVLTSNACRWMKWKVRDFPTSDTANLLCILFITRTRRNAIGEWVQKLFLLAWFTCPFHGTLCEAKNARKRRRTNRVGVETCWPKN